MATMTRDDRKSDPVINGVFDRPVNQFADARTVLRDDRLLQAGFRADLIERFGNPRFAPILFQHGDRHRAQRAATARFFAPRTVDTKYRALILEESRRLLKNLQANGEGCLDQLTLRLAVFVAAEIVGLTESDPAAMARRLEHLFSQDAATSGGTVIDLARFVRAQGRMWHFFVRDVLPAQRARRTAPRDDVISHLMKEGYGPRALLTECVTYAAAGMVTTREFISMAAWHILRDDDLRCRFVEADESVRIEILEEILRLEPVVGTLRRKTPDGGQVYAIDVRAANTDAQAMGACPFRIDPERERAERVPGPGLAFGDGSHRCPGASVALLEAAIFLGELVRLPNLTLAAEPTLLWNPLIHSYEVRNFTVTCRRGG
jgi:cytochrome P450